MAENDDTIAVGFLGGKRILKPTSQDLEQAQRKYGDWDQLTQYLYAASLRAKRDATE